MAPRARREAPRARLALAGLRVALPSANSLAIAGAEAARRLSQAARRSLRTQRGGKAAIVARERLGFFAGAAGGDHAVGEAEGERLARRRPGGR